MNYDQLLTLRGVMTSMPGDGKITIGAIPGMMKGGMGPMHQGMMQQGMMMAKPMKKYKMMVHTLPRMQAELSLSQDQTGELIDLQANFIKKQVDYKAQWAKKKMEVQGLLDKEAAADEVKNQLQACADIKVEMHTAAYETALEMKAVLDDAPVTFYKK